MEPRHQLWAEQDWPGGRKTAGGEHGGRGGIRKERERESGGLQLAGSEIRRKLWKRRWGWMDGRRRGLVV